MKICYLTHNTSEPVGYGRFSSEIINAAKSKGHETLVLTEVKERGSIAVLSRGFGIVRSSIAIRALIKDCDVIHALDTHPYGIIATLACVGMNKPIVLTAVGTYAIAPLYNIHTAFLVQWAYARARAVVTISEYTKNEIYKKIKRRDVKVIPPSFNFNTFYREHYVAKEPYVLAVGGPKEMRGYHISIPAFAKARQMLGLKNLKYKIVGKSVEESYMRYLKTLVAEYDVADAVEFLTNVSDTELSMLYAGASSLLYTPVNVGRHTNAFGIVFLEAAAAGTPVVGTLNNGNVEAVNEGKNGFLVPQNDIESTANALVTVLSDQLRWQTMSRAGYEFAKQCTERNPVAEYLSIYEKVLEIR